MSGLAGELTACTRPEIELRGLLHGEGNEEEMEGREGTREEVKERGRKGEKSS